MKELDKLFYPRNGNLSGYGSGVDLKLFKQSAAVDME